MIKRLLLAFALLGATPVWAADCFILEFSELARDQWSNRLDLANLSNLVAEQNVTYTTSTQSSAFNASTRYIRLVCDAKAHFDVGAAPAATATDAYISADVSEYFAVSPGDLIAFYDGSS